MFISVISVLIVISGISADVSYEYTKQANTTDGFPCFADCIKGRCLSDWDGATKECWSNKQPAPRYRTAENKDKASKYCISNCNYFGWNYQWCVTTKQKGWDYCNLEATAVSVWGVPCTSECKKGSTDYYWCEVENTTEWQFCAPPREDVEGGDGKEKTVEVAA